MIIIAKLLAFAGTKLGRYALAASLVAGWFAYYTAAQQRKGATSAIQKIERKSDALVKKAVSAQQRADQPGSPKRLLERYCSDC